MTKDSITARYQNVISALETQLSAEIKRERSWSLLRLLTAFIGVALLILAFQYGVIPGVVVLSILILAFFVIFLKHEASKSRIETLKTGILIKSNEIEAITNHKNMYGSGDEYTSYAHDYSEDLDIFGSNSLFGLINRCTSIWGMDYLANLFSNIPSYQEIDHRQEAINELSQKSEWRDEFITRMWLMSNVDDKNLINKIKALTTNNYAFAKAKITTLLIYAVPLFWMLVVVLMIIGFSSTFTVAVTGGILILIYYFWYAKDITRIHNSISTGKNYLEEYAVILKSIYYEKWNSKLLKDSINTNEGVTQIEALVKLGRLLDKLDYRLNMIAGFMLNILMLWDFRIVRKLSRWNAQHIADIPQLFITLGKFEAMSSLAIWSYNHPHFSLPEVTGQEAYYIESIRHPLLLDGQCIPNDFTIKKGSYINIITGSNMSGKSTFLRTLGINMILAYAGTVVNAVTLSVPLVRIITYMRIKDALEESVSTFKAELNRVKLILDSLNDDRPCIYLIDEMLRGTNSKDKLKGSISITKKLLSHQAYAIIATHDIKLAELGNQIPDHIENYYFDIEYEQEELVFDYKLKSGICSNFNASHLLKQIGVE